MQVLIDQGARLNGETKKKETPLYLASARGRADTITALVAAVQDRPAFIEIAGPDGNRPLHVAAKHGHVDAIAALLKAGADVNAQNATAAGKLSPLMLAAQQGHADAVMELLKAGGNLNAPDKVGRTPLIYAVMNGFASIAKILLNAGANVNAADTSLNTVAHYAAAYGWLSSVKLLHRIGAALWSLNDWGYSPMACAALKGRYDVSRFLINHAPEAGAIDFLDADGATLLFLQCKHAEDVDEIEFLLSKGADPNRATTAEEYPIQRLLSRLQYKYYATALLKALRLLLNYGARVTGPALDKHSTPLVLAIRAQSKEAFDLLLPRSELTPAVWLAAVANGMGFTEALLNHAPEERFS
ncbi:hypothetical protein ACHHYP_04150, partial [Achlya hypogyna]